MNFLKALSIIFLLSSHLYAMGDDPSRDREKHLAFLKIQDEKISKYKRRHQSEPTERNTDLLFNAYMQKAAAHFYLGERDKQIGSYKDILTIDGLPQLNVARTYANIGVVYLQLGKSIVAAAHLKKAQELVKLEELKDIMGPQTYSAFATTYDLAAESLYLSHPQQSLEYQLKSLSIPDQELVWYGRGNLKLAICYDRLLKQDESLICALDALKCKSLT